MAPAVDSAPDMSGDVPEGNDGVAGAETPTNKNWTRMERAYFHIGLITGLLSGSLIVAVMWWTS